MTGKWGNLTGRKRRLAGLAIAAAVSFSAGFVFFSFPSVNVLEWRLADHWARRANGETVSRNVAVIGVDEKLLHDYGWPLEKDIYGDLIDYLTEMGAKVIAFDIIFADNLDACGKGDSVFREMVSYTPNAVFSYGAIFDESEQTGTFYRLEQVPQRFSIGTCDVPLLRMKGAVLPYPKLLDKVHNLGFNNHAKPFVDGIDRRMPMFLEQDSLVFPSLSLVTSCLYQACGKPFWNRLKNVVSVGKTAVRVDKEGYLYVNFSDSIPVYTVSQVRASHRDWLLGKTPQVGRPELQGRVVFIGNTALSLGDFGVTPLSGKTAMGRSPSVLMHARATATILDANAIRFFGRPAAILFSAVVLVAAFFLFLFLPAQISLPAVVLCLAGGIVAGQRLYIGCNFVPMLEGVGSGTLFCILGSLVVYFEKELDRRFLYGIFKTYLSPDIIDDMFAKKIKPKLGGEQVFATAFFSDLENFTTFSEVLSPSESVDVLNRYFSEMTRILIDGNGTLDKFIGDAMVAFFGAPLPSHRHAHEACIAAVQMQEALAKLRAEWAQKSEVPEAVKNLKMRIGINTGSFVTGNIGCDMRMNYTMIGDTVNVASRLEGAAKEYGAYTVTGEETYRTVRHDFRFRKLDVIDVRGRETKVVMYQLMGSPREDDKKMLELIDRYEKALGLYLAKDFTKASRLFEESLKLEKFSGLLNPSSVMLKRCRRFEKIKPNDWDGGGGTREI
jgi:adenylate cyclase